MTYVQINTVLNGSTGAIMRGIHNQEVLKGNDSWCFYGRGRKSYDSRLVKFSNDAGCKVHGLLSRITYKDGFYSELSTHRLVKYLDTIHPDVVHLHNLHGHYLHVGILFDWLLRNECAVKWTLHDCWSFTGHCAYYSFVDCNRWKSHCALDGSCPLSRQHAWISNPRAVFDSYDRKKSVFTSLPADRMTLITPSKWLADEVRASYLSKYHVDVVHNQIDRSVFKPTVSKFRDIHRIGNRIMILGVASPWSKRKGLDDFIRLSQLIDNDRFVIVLVGLSIEQIKSLPSNIVGLMRTDSMEELAAIYTAADVFFNPTYEDNYPTVNLEAEACGTCVYTYDTGGCRETISLPESRVVNFDDMKLWISLSSV